MVVKLGEGIEEMLGHIVEEQGDLDLSEEDAVVVGCSKAVKVKDLTQHQLLQYALVTACIQRDHLQGMCLELADTRNKLQQLVNKLLEEKIGPNRETRRRLQLP